MKPVYLEAIGLAAPGLDGWDAAAAVLRGEQPYQPVDLPPQLPQLLPPNERRRAPPAVRLAFRAAGDAVAMSSRDAGALATVFASSDADMGILHRICSALAQPGRVVSPTDFHNSVHNAAAGYWGIAVGNRLASDSVAGHDASFVVGLVTAATRVCTEDVDVLLVAYDVPPPPPLLAKRPIAGSAGVALVLTAAPPPRPLAALSLTLGEGAQTTLDDPGLEALRLGNPAARALPLLQRIAQAASGTVHLPYAGDAMLSVNINT